MLEKARTLPADAIILDLEDSVPVGEKQSARAMVCEALQTGTYGPEVVVRINDLSTDFGRPDLEEVLCPSVQAILLPKAQTVDDVHQVGTLVASLERQRGLCARSVRLLLLVETALGVVNAHVMATADERVSALCLGGEDLSRDMGAIRTKEGIELVHARAQVVLAARAAGVCAVDTVFTDLDDQTGLWAEAALARQLGYSGKLLIHPKQIEAVHQAFAPREEEIAYAHRVVAAFKAALEQGRGACVLDGKMIDAPIVARARELLTRA
jgi:citrate lyase subunit beta/citryl-CoA lyase